MAQSVVVGACPHDCPDTCSILTTVEDGKAIESEAIQIIPSPGAAMRQGE